MVKKAEGGWQMCVDYIDLNKASPKNCYPLLRIDTLVDSVMGNEILCFLDTFKRYNQIGMSEKDHEKIAFIIDWSIFSYTTMPFGLKNARVMYQRLANKIFHQQIDKNMEACIDNMLVKI